MHKRDGANTAVQRRESTSDWRARSTFSRVPTDKPEIYSPATSEPVSKMDGRRRLAKSADARTKVARRWLVRGDMAAGTAGAHDQGILGRPAREWQVVSGTADETTGGGYWCAGVGVPPSDLAAVSVIRLSANQ